MNMPPFSLRFYEFVNRISSSCISLFPLGISMVWVDPAPPTFLDTISVTIIYSSLTALPLSLLVFVVQIMAENDFLFFFLRHWTGRCFWKTSLPSVCSHGHMRPARLTVISAAHCSFWSDMHNVLGSVETLRSLLVWRSYPTTCLCKILPQKLAGLMAAYEAWRPTFPESRLDDPDRSVKW